MKNRKFPTQSRKNPIMVARGDTIWFQRQPPADRIRNSDGECWVALWFEPDGNIRVQVHGGDLVFMPSLSYSGHKLGILPREPRQ